MSRVFGYIRVSTHEQADSGAGLAAQRQQIEAEANRRCWELTEIVEDAGWSGASMDRPGVTRLLPSLKRGDVLVVSKLDRLSRSLVDAVGLMEASQKRGWVLIALDLGVDTGTPTGRLVASVMAAVATWERAIIAERTRDAMAAKKQAGQVRYGHRSTIPVPVQEQVERLHTAGVPLAEIARRLTGQQIPTAWGCPTWYASTVRSVLASRANDRLAGLA